MGTDLSGQPSSWLRQRCPGLMAAFAARGQQRAALHICKGTCRGSTVLYLLVRIRLFPFLSIKRYLTPLCLFGFNLRHFHLLAPFLFFDIISLLKREEGGIFKYIDPCIETLNSIMSEACCKKITLFITGCKVATLAKCPWLPLNGNLT